MNDIRPWPKRNPSSPTGRFVIATGCNCRMCREEIPWRLVKAIAIVGFTILLAVNL